MITYFVIQTRYTNQEKMRHKSLEIEEIVRLFKEKDIMTIEEMVRKTNRSRDTVFRRLREHEYHTSYNKNGKYYTLPEIAKFDDEGFWRVDDVYFSKFGGIKDVVNVLVETSKSGYRAEELNIKLGTRVSNHLKGFVQKGILTRRKYSDFYVYFSTDEKKQKTQVERREQHIMIKETPEFDEYLSIRKIDDKLVIHVLLEFINNREAMPKEIASALGRKNIKTKKEIVEEIFRRYDLLKKTI